jgi:hypothetical protein
MTVSLIDLSGDVAKTQTCAPVNPGGVCQTETTSPAHCRIEFKGSKRAVRGSLSVNSSSGNDIEVIEPAR